jgi:hypothetical protein
MDEVFLEIQQEMLKQHAELAEDDAAKRKALRAAFLKKWHPDKWEVQDWHSWR